MSAAPALTLAPAGWGWRPGAVLAADDAAIMAALPELPLLSLVGSRNQCVREALAALPHLVPLVRPRHLVKKYGLPQVSASTTLQKLRGEIP